MPIAAPKPCRNAPRCSHLAKAGRRFCTCCQKAERRRYDRTRPSAAARGYGPAWRRKRRQFLRDHPTCELDQLRERVRDVHDVGREGRLRIWLMKQTERCLRASAEPHHLQRVRDGGTHHDDNLVALCRPHHSGVTSIEDQGLVGGQW